MLLYPILALAGGCHTIDAVSRLRSPTPAKELSLRTTPVSSIEWRAVYGPSSYPDNWAAGLFGRSVARQGTWTLSDTPTPCALVGSRIARLSHAEFVLVFAIPEPQPSAAYDIHQAELLGCSHLLVPSGIPTDFTTSPAAVLVTDLATREAAEFAVPEEMPACEPDRWLWLAAAPALDVVTAIVAIPVFIGLGIADLVP